MRKRSAKLEGAARALDRWMEGSTRTMARRVSRRSFLGRLGAMLAGGAAVPLLRGCIASSGLCTESDWNPVLSALQVEQEWTFVLQPSPHVVTSR